MASIQKRLVAATAAAGLALTLGGCMGDYGYGGIGYASDYYDGYGGYGPYGYGPSFAYGGYGGWYNDFYYPGTGIYVFDRSGRRSRWNDSQRRYWEGRRGNWQGQRGEGRRAEWNGQRGQWNGLRGQWNGQGRPGGDRPDRGQWRGNRPTGTVPNAAVGAERPSRQGFSGGQWRGRGGASIGAPGGSSFQGRAGGFRGGGFGSGQGRGGGHRH